MRIAVFSTDPVLAEGIGSLIRESGEHESVLCSRTLADLAALENLYPDLLILSEEFDEPAHRLAIEPVRKMGAKSLLIVGSNVGRSHDASQWDAVVDRRLGSSLLIATVREMFPSATDSKSTEIRLDSHRESQLRGLTAREQEVALLVGKGLRNKEIAALLGTGEQNIKAHVQRAMRLLGCKSRVELALQITQGPASAATSKSRKM